MKMWHFLQIMMLILMLTASALIGCGTTSSGCGGTETGNPAACPTTGSDDDGETASDDGDDSGIDSAEQLAVTEELLSGLCGAVDACYDNFVNADCVDFVNTDANTIDAFGINTAVIESFEEVQGLIDAGTVNVDTEAVDACLAGIESITCASMGALAIFSESNQRYTQVYRIAQPECADIFSE